MYVRCTIASLIFPFNTKRSGMGRTTFCLTDLASDPSFSYAALISLFYGQ